MNEQQQHIVVVDDEEAIRETISEYLSDQGFRVTPVENGADLRSLVESEEEIDLAILDISMPGEDGLSLARYLAESTDIVIIMVTASGETVDRIVGLEMGADDYLAKPVELRELLARIKAVLRRTTDRPNVRLPSGEQGARIAFGKCQLDLDAHQMFDEDGAEIKLTAMEFDLMKAFAERPNRVLTRDTLMDLAHHGDWEPFDRSIDIRISRLRRKIERDPAKPEVLKTMRGAGYMFVSEIAQD